jgi:hypothetical protein
LPCGTNWASSLDQIGAFAHLIGLEEVGDGTWNIVYYSTLLWKIDERSLQITGAK